jgi:hypothetical protein
MPLSIEEIYTNMLDNNEHSEDIHRILDNTLQAVNSDPRIQEILKKKDKRTPIETDTIMQTVRSKLTAQINALPEDAKKIRIIEILRNNNFRVKDGLVDFGYLIVGEGVALHPPVPAQKPPTRPSSTFKKSTTERPLPSQSSHEQPLKKQKVQGGKATYTFKGHSYVIRTGDRGGKYILVKGKKIYV